MVIEERLKTLRKEKNLTQKDLAKALNISREVIVNWESPNRQGEPNIEMLIVISNFYGVSIDYLCGATDIRDRIYEDPNLCKYLNRCIAIYDEFFKKD